MNLPLLSKRYITYCRKNHWYTAMAINTDDGWILYGNNIEEHPTEDAALNYCEEKNNELEREIRNGKGADN